MSFLLALLSLQLLPAPDSVQWERAADDGTGIADIDPSSIRREGGMATGVVRVRVPPSAVQNGVATIVVRQSMNCRTEQYAILTVDQYDAGGRFLSSREATPESIAYIDLPPSPDRARYIRRFCG